MANNSILPTNQIFFTENSLRDFDTDCGKISRLINRLNPHKAHGRDGISIRMMKLCNLTVTKPLSIIYKNCLQQGVFPDEWKKGNIIPVHKKNSKQILDNYRPVSLLPICSKIFEKLILTVSMSSLMITFSTRTNKDSDLMTLAYISLFTLHITFSVLLMLTLHWKFVAFSLIYLKHSIEFGMMVSFINSRVMELTVTSLNLLNRF